MPSKVNVSRFLLWSRGRQKLLLHAKAAKIEFFLLVISMWESFSLDRDGLFGKTE